MSRLLVSSARSLLCILAMTAHAWAGGGCPGNVDQSNLDTNAVISVTDTQTPGQTFVVGMAGQLVGIEVAPVLQSLSPDAVVFLDVSDGLDQLLGTASRTAMGFPPGATVPDPLEADVIGPGYFDLSSLGIIVAVNDTLSFRVRHEEFGVCDTDSNTCVEGSVGQSCSQDDDCDVQMRLGDDMNAGYPSGTELVNETPDPSFDLAFKTFVGPSCLGLCGAAPRSGCRASIQSQKSLVLLKDAVVDDAKDTLTWKWTKGVTTPKSAFGQPATGTTAYELCLYDAGGLISRGRVPAGGTCGAKPCWTEKPTSFKYKDAAGTNGGIRSVVLKEGAFDGKPKITVKGKGLGLDMPDLLSLASPLTVQLVNEDSECWTNTFSFPPAIKIDARQFKDKAD